MQFDNAGLRLSAQRALLGAVSKPILGTCIDATEQSLTMTVYTEPDLDEEYQEALDIALTEIWADFPFIASIQPIVFVETNGTHFQTAGTWEFLRFGCTVVS